jgi:hypothetical protein
MRLGEFQGTSERGGEDKNPYSFRESNSLLLARLQAQRNFKKEDNYV